MEPYEKIIIKLLPGDTPKQKAEYLKKMAKTLIEIGWSSPSDKYKYDTIFKMSELVYSNFSIDDLEMLQSIK